ncbi:uncharacterized protein [Procambarus clarkii]|uniref:uncharacterized protein n=1 Tax=Procambarus clarkii TaxID=6728 RepID=UPI003743348B
MPMHSAPGLDSWNSIFIKKCKVPVAQALSIIWRKSLDTGEIPAALKSTDIAPLHKTGLGGVTLPLRPSSAVGLGSGSVGVLQRESSPSGPLVASPAFVSGFTCSLSKSGVFSAAPPLLAAWSGTQLVRSSPQLFTSGLFDTGLSLFRNERLEKEQKQLERQKRKEQRALEGVSNDSDVDKTGPTEIEDKTSIFKANPLEVAKDNPCEVAKAAFHELVKSTSSKISKGSPTELPKGTASRLSKSMSLDAVSNAVLNNVPIDPHTSMIYKCTSSEVLARGMCNEDAFKRLSARVPEGTSRLPEASMSLSKPDEFPKRSKVTKSLSPKISKDSKPTKLSEGFLSPSKMSKGLSSKTSKDIATEGIHACISMEVTTRKSTEVSKGKTLQQFHGLEATNGVQGEHLSSTSHREVIQPTEVP